MTAGPLLWIGLAFVTGALGTRWLSHRSGVLAILDEPTGRSLHVDPVPKTGGLAILTGITVGFVGAAVVGVPYDVPSGVWAGLLLLVAISFLDDLRGLPAWARLPFHLVAGLIVVVPGLFLEGLAVPGFSWMLPPWLAGSLTLLFIVWMINLYNFMDGMNGFAAGMAVFGFGTMGVLGFLSGFPGYAALNGIIAAAAAGFLLHNFSGRIFMGDVGSTLLGYLAAVMAIWGVRSGISALWVYVLVFSPFIVDATVTLFRRMLRRETVWTAHRSHFYQRLVRAGWSHRRTVLWEYVIMALASLSALVVERVGVAGQQALLVGWVTLYAILIFWTSRFTSRVADTRPVSSCG